MHVDDKTAFDMQFKWGSFYQELTESCQQCLHLSSNPLGFNKICECENITEQELNWVRSHFDVKRLDDYRQRTRQEWDLARGSIVIIK